jgi:hypothetical protein
MPVPQISHKRILVGVLNWGMGHASRSSVIIENLIGQQNTVELVSSGIAFNYLQNRFPNLTIHNLNFPELIYPSHNQLWLNLLLQQKKITGGIKQENNWIKKYVETNVFDLIISDNCYGFFHESVQSILITHQLNLKTPFFEKKLNRKIQYLIAPFNEVWIPDEEGEMNLSGELSHPVLASKKCVYIGALSALQKTLLPSKYTWCAVISGPEKQRTIFENKVLEFLSRKKEPAVLIRGIFSKKSLPVNKTISVFNFLQGPALAETMNASENIICRSGYSSIMDLYTLEKPCLMVPTPGQTEQEYLFQKHTKLRVSDLENVQPVKISLCRG